MNRIVERFARLKGEAKKGFIVYLGAGEPNLEATRQLALAFDKLGVDVLELGVPFSDPLADGLMNQLAAQHMELASLWFTSQAAGQCGNFIASDRETVVHQKCWGFLK